MDDTSLDDTSLDDTVIARPADLAERERRRPGRFRRWILRPAAWALALLAILIFVAQLLLDTSYARQWASQTLAEKASVMLDREVEVADISLTLLPLAVEVWGIKIGGPEDMEPDLSFLEIPWASVEVDLRTLKQNVLRLDQVRLERPRIFLQYWPEGRSNVLRLNRPDRPKRRAPSNFNVYIEHIEVDRAELLLDNEAVQWTLSGDELRGRFQGMGHLHVEGEVTAQNLVVRLPRAKPITASVSAKGSIRRGRVEIEHARASGSGISAEAYGTCGWPLEDMRNKKCEIQVKGSSSGAKLAEIGYFPHLEGRFDFDGTYVWRPRVSGWRSRLTAPTLEIWDRKLEDVDATLVADRYQVRLALAHARYGGGAIEGAIDVSAQEEGRPMNVDLDFRGVDLNVLLADQKIPAGDFASRVSGNVVYRFPIKDSRHGNGHGEVKVTADVEREGLPLEGDFPLRIEGGVVRTESISLRSERQSLLASGFFDVDRRRGLFDYEVATADLLQVIDVLQLVDDGEPWPQWLPHAGEGELAGTLQLRPEGTATEMRLSLEKVYGPDLVTPHRLSGGFRLDRRGLDPMRIELGDGSAALMFHGVFPFDDPEGDVDEEAGDDTGFQLTFVAYEWPLDSIRPWLKFDLTLDGRVSGRLDLHADDTGSDGRLRAVVSPAVFMDAPLEAVGGRLNWDAERLEFDEFTLRSPAGEVQGRGTLHWPRLAADGTVTAPDVLDIELEAAALELGEQPLVRYLPRRGLTGEVAATAHLGGSREHPRLDLQVRAEEVAVGARVIESRPSELRVKWGDGHVEASGRLLDMVTLRGGGDLDRRRGDLTFDLDGNDVAGLLELLYEEPPEDVDGSFQGRLRVVDEAGRDRRIDLELERMDVEFRGHRLANLEPVTLSLALDHLEIGSLYLEERATGSEFFLTGRVGYEDGSPLDLRLQATLANQWLELYQPDLSMDGYFDLLGRVGGTVERPYFDGQGEVRRGRMTLAAVPDFPHTFEDLEGILRFYPEEVVVDRLQASLAGGQVWVEGRSDVPRDGEPLRYRLQLSGRQLRVRYPKDWLLDGDMDLVLRTQEPEAREGPLESSYLLTGRADLRALEYSQDIPLGFAQIMQDTLLRQRLEVTQADEIRSAVQLNVEVHGPEALQVRNNLAELKGDIELSLRGNLAQPILFGAIDLDPGGQLNYSSVDYEIDRGRLSFANPYQFDPEVDLVATTRVRDYDVILTLSGTAERLNAGFSSEPPLPALEVFELLATGGDEALEANAVRRQNELGQEQSMSAATFLYGQAADVIGERVSNLFGFDKFRIAPLTGSGDQLSKARLTVGKRLSKDVFVSYSRDPSSTEEERLQIEWQVSRGLVLVLTQNGDSTYEADARWETSF